MADRGRGRRPARQQPSRPGQKARKNEQEEKETKEKRKAAEAKAEAIKGTKLPLTMEYLNTWAHNRSEWKFKKVRQNVRLSRRCSIARLSLSLLVWMCLMSSFVWALCVIGWLKRRKRSISITAVSSLFIRKVALCTFVLLCSCVCIQIMVKNDMAEVKKERWRQQRGKEKK